MTYFRNLARDAGLLLRERRQLLVIAAVVSLALVGGHYRPVRMPWFSPGWRVAALGLGPTLVFY